MNNLRLYISIFSFRPLALGSSRRYLNLKNKKNLEATPPDKRSASVDALQSDKLFVRPALSVFI